MTLPQLMSKIWDGDPDEYFTWLDMNRVEYNANALARECGVSEVEFMEVGRASQFRYDEANKLEALILACARARGLSPSMELAWSYNRAISYVDFERWESSLWDVYTDLGGVGERIPAGKVLVTYSAVLYASQWSGSGPYYQDLEMPGIRTDTDALVYGAHTNSVEQRADEYNAVLKPQLKSDRQVRIWALSLKPRNNLPIKISIGGFHLHQEISLPASGWSGSGPWTQTVTLSSSPVNAVIGQWEGMSDDAVIAMMDAKISVSAMSGTSVTVRAIGTKPTIALNPLIMWETSESE